MHPGPFQLPSMAPDLCLGFGVETESPQVPSGPLRSQSLWLLPGKRARNDPLCHPLGHCSHPSKASPLSSANHLSFCVPVCSTQTHFFITQLVARGLELRLVEPGLQGPPARDALASARAAPHHCPHAPARPGEFHPLDHDWSVPTSEHVGLSGTVF